MIVLSAVLIFVDLNEISITVPSLLPTQIQSPTKKGLSVYIDIPEINPFTKSCAAKATSAPPIPSPATKPDISYPNSYIIVKPANAYITHFKILEIKFTTV